MIFSIFYVIILEILMFENLDIQSIVTPIKADILESLLIESGYDEKKRKKIVRGFKKGFRLGYEGPRKNIMRKAPNLKLRVGDKIELWNKVMKEVKHKRYAGPFKKILFKYFIQSPIGLVPKDHGKDTRLIFHLSYPKTGDSVNSMTPEKICKVKYPDFNDAIQRCMEEIREMNDSLVCDGKQIVYSGKSDLKSAFRAVPLRVSEFMLLIMKAENPVDKLTYYFLDKCLPFGASISCKIFQDFSDCLAHLQRYRTGKIPINYLDDFFFTAILKSLCNMQVNAFINICNEIGMPVSLEKTEWASTVLVFLGLLINGKHHIVAIPAEKVYRALNLINEILDRKKMKVIQLQKLCGFLNFLCKSITPGRVFTRRLYAYTAGTKLKPHHHIRLRKEMKMDLNMWKVFLNHQSIFCRPFIDFEDEWNADRLNLYTDASKNTLLGCGGFCDADYFSQRWDQKFIEDFDPSIEFLELYAVVCGVMLWIHRFPNRRVILFCDNNSAVGMINSSSSNCKNCMILLRLMTLKAMIHNVRIYAQWVSGKTNKLANFLSRMKMKQFWQEVEKKNLTMNKRPTEIPEEMWPMTKVWFDNL